MGDSTIDYHPWGDCANRKQSGFPLEVLAHFAALMVKCRYYYYYYYYYYSPRVFSVTPAEWTRGSAPHGSAQ